MTRERSSVRLVRERVSSRTIHYQDGGIQRKAVVELAPVLEWSHPEVNVMICTPLEAKTASKLRRKMPPS